jgi:photosystem I subunit 8
MKFFIVSNIQNKFNFYNLIMAAAYLPSILVPLVGLVFPLIGMASLFLYIEKEEIV